jgi:2-methylisocitrate lyase-like PEP mutase family enzyme
VKIRGVPGALRARDPAAAREQLRMLLARPGAALVPGVADALSARLVEEAGFGVCYLSGAAVANAQFGVADVGLITATEMVEQARRVVAATALPVLVDGDTGYGNPLNVMRTVADLERAGAAGVQLEDQTTPKRCGHFDGKEVITTEEMVQKIRAAMAARTDDQFVIVARTDAAATLGLDAALERARAYAAAGADVLFVEAPPSEEALRRVCAEVPSVPHLVNMVEGGATPILPRQVLEEMGFRLILYANLLLRATALGAQRALVHLAEHGDSDGIQEDILSWPERQRLVDFPAIRALEHEFVADAGIPTATSPNSRGDGRQR